MEDQPEKAPYIVPEGSKLEKVLTELGGISIDWLLPALPVRDQRIMELRYGLISGEIMTLRAVGQEIGLSGERIRQREALSLHRLTLLRNDVERFLRERDGN